MVQDFDWKIKRNKFYKTTLIDVVFYFVAYIYSSFLSPYLQELGWSQTRIGWFFSVFAITSIIISPIIGTISDKVSRFKILIGGFILEIISLAGFILFKDTFLILFFRILSAIAFNLVSITAFSRVNDTFSDNNRSKKTGIFETLLSASKMIAPLIGGIVADSYGYKAVFAVAILTSIVFIIGLLIQDKLFYKKHISSKKKEKIKLKDGNPLIDIKKILKIKEIRLISLLGMSTAFTTPFTMMILPFLIIDKMGLDNTHLSIAFFVLGGAHLTHFIMGFLANKIGEKKGIFIGVLIKAISIIAVFFTKSFYVLLFLLLTKAVGESLWYISAWSFMSNFGEKKGIEGQIVGGYNSLISIAQAVSFVIAGAILSHIQEGIFFVYGFIILIPLIYVSRKLLFSRSIKIKVKNY